MPHGSSPAPAPAATADLPDGYRFELGDFAVDEYKPIRVIVIGAGLGGIFAGIRYVGVLRSPAHNGDDYPQVPTEGPER